MHQQIINGRQLKANIVLRETELAKLQNDLRREEVLGERNVIGKKNSNMQEKLLPRQKRH